MAQDNEKKKKRKTGRKPTGLTGVKKTIYITPEVASLLEEEADEETRSVSKMVEIILRERYKTKLEAKKK